MLRIQPVGNEDEGCLRPLLACDGESTEAVAPRRMPISQDDINVQGLNLPNELGFRLDADKMALDPAVFQFCADGLYIGLAFFQMNDVERAHGLTIGFSSLGAGCFRSSVTQLRHQVEAGEERAEDDDEQKKEAQRTPGATPFTRFLPGSALENQLDLQHLYEGVGIGGARLLSALLCFKHRRNIHAVCFLAQRPRFPCSFCHDILAATATDARSFGG